jgi:hypothetical protein
MNNVDRGGVIVDTIHRLFFKIMESLDNRFTSQVDFN